MAARSRKADPLAETPADPAAPPGWWRFDGAYPVVLVARGVEVVPGDVVHWPAGPPDDANWSPADPPTEADPLANPVPDLPPAGGADEES